MKVRVLLLLTSLFVYLGCEEKPVAEVISEIKFDKPLSGISYNERSNQIIVVEESEFLFGREKKNEHYEAYSINLTTLEKTKIADSKAEFSCVKHSPDFSKFVIGTKKGDLTIYDSNDNNIQNSININQDWIYDLTFHPSGNSFFVINAFDKHFYSYDINLTRLDSINIGKQINKIQSSEKALFLANFQESEVRLYENIDSFSTFYTKPLSSFIVNNSVIIISDFNGIIKTLDHEGNEQLIFNKHFKKIEDFDLEGDYLITGSNDQSFMVWDLLLERTIFESFNIHRGEIKLVSFTDKGFLTFGEDKILRNWNLRKKR
jgi:WD40 repeat protein